MVFLLFGWWIVGLPLLLAGSGTLIYRAWRNSVDDRFQDVKERILSYQSDFPLLIFSLEQVADDDGLEGGWHNLERM